ncbi:hypothetical protein CVT25_006119, partial [Psilocybe cyanescens]
CAADGSYSSKKAKPDPREQQIDDEFLARNYRQDSSGRFHTQPTPTSSMFSPQGPGSNRSNKAEQKRDESSLGDPEVHRLGVVQLKPPTLGIDGSASTDSMNVSSGSDGKVNPEIVVSAPG